MKKWQKNGLAAILLFVTSWGMLLWLTYDSTRVYFEEEYERRFAGGVTQFPLKELTRFEWDEVCFVAPYDSTEYVIKPYKFYSHFNRMIPASMQEPGEQTSYWVLVFINNRIKELQFIRVNNVKFPNKKRCYLSTVRLLRQNDWVHVVD